MRTTVTRYDTPLQQLLLLEERVRRAGVTLPEDADQPERFHGIKCLVNGRHCLLDIRAVAEVIGYRHVTHVPGSLPWIEGIMNYRGLLVPVYNLRMYFDREHGARVQGSTPMGTLVVCRCGQERVAIRVDRVAGMQKFLLSDFSTGTPDKENHHGMQQYCDACIDSGETRWWRFEIRQLLHDLASQDPMQQPAESAQQRA